MNANFKFFVPGLALLALVISTESGSAQQRGNRDGNNHGLLLEGDAPSLTADVWLLELQDYYSATLHFSSLNPSRMTLEVGLSLLTAAGLPPVVGADLGGAYNLACRT